MIDYFLAEQARALNLSGITLDPHHWCFPLISFKQIFSGAWSYYFWVHFLRTGKSRPFWENLQNQSAHSQLVACSLGMHMYSSCQESHSQPTCEKELLFSHLNVEVTPGETTNHARWRGQDSPVPFTASKLHQFFVSFSVWAPDVNHLLLTDDTTSEKGTRHQVGSVTSPSPQAQLTLTKTKVVPACLERESRFPSEVWGSHWSPPPKPAGGRKHLFSHPSTAGISSTAMQTTSPSY